LSSWLSPIAKLKKRKYKINQAFEDCRMYYPILSGVNSLRLRIENLVKPLLSIVTFGNLSLWFHCIRIKEKNFLDIAKFFNNFPQAHFPVFFSNFSLQKVQKQQGDNASEDIHPYLLRCEVRHGNKAYSRAAFQLLEAIRW